ncbi:MAG: PDZ domain-containing protein [Pirellula sp.]|jgi:serine protease Do|nr:PDZ domain-containing protein [Pirellula sp.]
MKRINRHARVALASALISFCVCHVRPSDPSDFNPAVTLVSYSAEGSGSTLATDDDASQSHSNESSGKSLLVQQGYSVGDQVGVLSGRGHTKTHYQTLRAFRDSVGNAWKSTVQILNGNRQVALGAIVHSGGWIVSKSSEVPDQCEVKLFDGTKAIGSTVLRKVDLDLAILKIEREGLQPVVLNPKVDVPLGGWLVSTNIRSTPLNVGVLSVTKRNVPSERPVLGLRLGEAPAGQNGALIESVVDGGGADRAGVQVGDVIKAVDGVELPNRARVLDHLRSITAGQHATLTCDRDGRKMTFRAQMMDLTSSLFDSTEMEVNGEISSRATGFKNVMQHDTVLLPHQCGGPIVDIDGNFVGLNIARGGRVVSLAYNVKDLQPVVFDMLRTLEVDITELWNDSKIVANGAESATDQLSQSTASQPAVPASIPAYIQVESLKPEVIVPQKN